MTATVQQDQHTMYFLGTSTANSASRRMFPQWAKILRLGDAQLLGIDIPLNAPADVYKSAVSQIKEDPLSLGALITSHKLNVAQAASNLFDDFTSDAALCGEVSCIYKEDDLLIGHTTDPLTSGLAMNYFLGDNYWREHQADALVLGAGGAAVALLAYVATRAPVDNRPRRLLLIDRDLSRLQHIDHLLRRLATVDVSVELIHNERAAENDRLLAELPPYSLVVNATGMGKDIPGSRITDEAVFPQNGAAWELNYRGKLDFLQQARAQEAQRNLRITDGWHYFLLGWTTVIGYVFSVDVDDATFVRLAEAANAVR